MRNDYMVSDKSVFLPKTYVKGKIGENKVRLDLYRLPEDEYLVLHDVMIRNENNITTQIDHLIFSKYGIFVIETKNYSGLIIGKNKYKEWIKYVGNEKIKIPNPVLQNYGHVQELKKALDISEKVFIPLVCIYGNCKLDVEWDKTVKFKYLVDRIGFFKEIKLLDYKHVYERVKEMNITDIEQKKQHARDKKIQSDLKKQTSIVK